MEPRTLVVLIDGEPEDAALVSRAREYADAKDCSVTLLHVVPELTSARTAGGVVILPWQIMQAMEAEAKYQLENLRARFLRGRAHPNTKLVRFGRVHEEVATVIDGGDVLAVLARSRRSLLPWLTRDARLRRRLAVPVLFLDRDDRLIWPARRYTLEANSG
jgi:nucleotide-binding universal stress UspA family protein